MGQQCLDAPLQFGDAHSSTDAGRLTQSDAAENAAGRADPATAPAGLEIQGRACPEPWARGVCQVSASNPGLSEARGQFFPPHPELIGRIMPKREVVHETDVTAAMESPL